MKTTIELPDDLYRRVKARSALEGKTVREVATSLFQQWADGAIPRGADQPAVDAPRQHETAASEWLRRFQAIGTELSEMHPDGSAVEQLYVDRRRLDR
ncbi:hypothetical protein [Gemmatimonas sp.]|jgi:hypothetical protein|uniref:hypothetical protein n=1 Tax=Gemmatimonas sp. TaxID=1962908 RepID=UPI0031C4D657|nr:hypothetical protein [Gemmatimonas sp.]